MTNVTKKSYGDAIANKVVWICVNGHVRSIGWTKPIPDEGSVEINDGNLSEVQAVPDVDLVN